MPYKIICINKNTRQKHRFLNRSGRLSNNAEAQRKQARSAISADGRLLLQSDGLLRIATPQVLGRLHLLEPLPYGDHGPSARMILPVQTAPSLLAFTSGGRVAALRWEFAAQQPGPLEKFLPDSVDGQGERVVEVLLPIPCRRRG